MEVME
jgi:hypothetical protein